VTWTDAEKMQARRISQGEEEIQRLRTSRLSLEREIKRFMPRGFIEAYDTLTDLIFGEGKGTSSPLGALQDNEGAGKQPLSKSWVTSNGGLRSEKAMDYRKNIDRKLRKLGREVDSWIEADADGREQIETIGSLRCRPCGRFVDSDWFHCAWCGHPTGARATTRS
jgi:hypothetical protein